MGDSQHNGLPAYPQKLQRDGCNDNARELMERGAIPESGDSCREADVADTISAGLQGHNEHESDNATRQPNQVPHGHAAPKGSSGGRSATWAPEPNVGRVVNGGSNRVDRLRLLGNGVVPQTASKAWETLEEDLTASPWG